MNEATAERGDASFVAARSTDLLLVPGLRDSGPAHWQTHWERHLGARRVVQDDFERADLEGWSDRIVETAVRGGRDLVLVAHSFGCLAAVHAAPRLARHLRALMLVAPASPAKFGIEHALWRPVEVPSLLVASRNDPWLSFDGARELVKRWSSRLHDLGHAGHINADSGYGPWPEGLELLSGLIDRTLDRAARLPAASLMATIQAMSLG